MTKAGQLLGLIVLIAVILLIILFFAHGSSADKRLRVNGLVKFSPDTYACNTKEQLNMAENYLQNSQKIEYEALFSSKICAALDADRYFRVVHIDSGSLEIIPEDQTDSTKKTWVSRETVIEATRPK